MTVNFFIVGAPKAGTTALYHFLKEHPEAFLSNPKEVNYFSCHEILQNGDYYSSLTIDSEAEYQKLFANAYGKKAVGEASVSYLYYPDVPRKIYEYNPDAKIIIMLRHPAERAFSHYLMDYRLGLVDEAFEQIVGDQTGRFEAYYRQYILLGMYHEQVSRYLHYFGNNTRIYFQEDLKTVPQQIMLDLYQFLGIGSFHSPFGMEKHNVSTMPRNKLFRKLYSVRALREMSKTVMPENIRTILLKTLFDQKNRPQLKSETRAKLLALFANDTENLEALLKVDLAHWKK